MAAMGKGYAKVILFGEHFVVYGLPGVAAGIDKYVQVEAQKVKDSDDVLFDDKVFNEKISLKENPEHIKCKIFHAMFDSDEYLPKKGIKFIINSNFPAGVGMGYSGALSVAMARAMNILFDQSWKDDKINELAHNGECISHTIPSGIDNTCSTYGTTVYFEKDLTGGKNIARPIKCGKALYFVLVESSEKHSTSEATEFVKKFKEKNQKDFDILCSDYKSIVSKVKKEIQFGGTEEIGKLMNKNNELLKQLGVSTPEIDQIVRIANFEGAFGTKLTGSGMGGRVLILCENDKHQDKIIASLVGKGFKATKVKVN
jgi:mevalonate kinase